MKIRKIKNLVILWLLAREPIVEIWKF
jgi:hypothetical protein